MINPPGLIFLLFTINLMPTPKNQNFYYLQCVKCRQKYTEDQTVTICLKCKNALEVHYDYDYIKGRLNFYALKNSPLSARKYLDFYPINDWNKLITLNEGGTPLHEANSLGKKFGLEKLYIKEEGVNPTGVFKDRGSLVELTKAKEMGAKAVCCASTGNMASSVSAYAAIAQIPCYVFIPEGTPIGKLAQSLSYGARLIQVRGTYADCCHLCEKTAEKYGFYLAGDYAFRMEGHKTCAFEIIEQLFWKVPDAVIVPMGCGTNISSIWKGFKEMFKLGFVDRLPKMIGVQPANVPTIVDAFLKKKARYVRVEKPQSVASAVGIGEPQDDIKALRALRESKGYAWKASEEDILQAQQDLAKKEAIFIEPSSAIPVACLSDLLKKKVITPDMKVVCVATGAGLKDPKSVLSMIAAPATIEPDFAEVDHYIKNKLYQLQSAGSRKAKILWQKTPTQSRLAAFIKKEFNLPLEKRLLELVHEEVRAFEKKGKKLAFSDLQNIIEESFNALSMKKKVLEVQDFTTTTSKHKQAEAKVQVCYFGNCMEASAKGVGTVDAIITALRKVIADRDHLGIRLTDYNVEIATGEVEAVVKVIMTLMDSKRNKVISTTSSPDVIVASVSAFEKGYNILYHKNQNGGK